MNITNGLMRGIEVIDTRTPLSVLVGGATLGFLRSYSLFKCLKARA